MTSNILFQTQSLSFLLLALHFHFTDWSHTYYVSVSLFLAATLISLSFIVPLVSYKTGSYNINFDLIEQKYE